MCSEMPNNKQLRSQFQKTSVCACNTGDAAQCIIGDEAPVYFSCNFFKDHILST